MFLGEHDAYSEMYEKALVIARNIWQTVDVKHKQKLAGYIVDTEDKL